ncbi:MAG: sensor histidine kinase [Planctomycetota bacterium]
MTTVLRQVGQELDVLGTASDDPSALPRAIAAALGAEWIAFREGGGEWSGLSRADRGGVFHAAEAFRRIDLGLLSRLPRDRVVRLAGPSLGRSPRYVDAGLCEVLVYIESAGAGLGHVVVIALGRSLAVDRGEIEAVLRAWIGLAALRTRMGRVEEHRQQREMEARAACALHDLRHELTVAGLELDLASTESAPVPGAGSDRIRAALARARALCEDALELPSPEHPPALRIEELLGTEGRAAHSVSGRGDSIRIEVRCETGLEFPVDRGMLSRIVRNLVLNAIENSPEGERVVIEAERGPQDQLRLRVIDQGRGMSAVDRSELSRFGRSGRGGLGIGSASVATCARSIGASVNVDSHLGAGTRVELSVPAARGSARPSPSAPRNPPRHAGTPG